MVLILAVSILATALLASRFETKAVLALGRSVPGDHLAGLPQIILWAWERPEDLRFIDPRQVGVAFLAKTLYLRGERVIIRPRLQPLQVPQGTALMAVVRIEADRFEPPDLLSGQQAAVVAALVAVARLPGIAALQVDFDATVSQRPFYRDLLCDLRCRLPQSMGLSITALASWCLSDTWLAGLPIDEAVPMLFRLGVDRHQVLLHLATGGDFRPALCRHSVGISTDEPRPQVPGRRRVYIFHPQAWSPAAARPLIKEVQAWQ